MYRRVQRNNKQDDLYEGPFQIEEEESPGIYLLRTDRGLIKARTHFLKRTASDGNVRLLNNIEKDSWDANLNESPSQGDLGDDELDSSKNSGKAKQSLVHEPHTVEHSSADEETLDLNVEPRRSTRRGRSKFDLSTQETVEGEDDLAVSDYENSDQRDTSSDSNVSEDFAQSAGKRKRKLPLTKVVRRKRRRLGVRNTKE